MKIVVTGSTSSIGNYLSEILSQEGHIVIALGGSNSEIWKLGQVFPSNISADALIHLAHDRRLSQEENILAAKKLSSSFQGYQLFLSSISSHSKSKSIYGSSKYSIEQEFCQSDAATLRAGIVYGIGIQGVYETLQTLIARLPIIPLPYSGKSRMFTTHIDDLCTEICKMLKEQPTGIFLAANPWPMSFKALVQEIANEVDGKKKIVIPISRFLTRRGLDFLTFLGFKNPNLDSLKSLDSEVSLPELGSIFESLTPFRSLSRKIR